MCDIARWTQNVGTSTNLEACPEGEFVLFVEYEDKLLDAQYEYDQLQKKYDALVNKLGEIYRDA